FLAGIADEFAGPASRREMELLVRVTRDVGVHGADGVEDGFRIQGFYGDHGAPLMRSEGESIDYRADTLRELRCGRLRAQRGQALAQKALELSPGIAAPADLEVVFEARVVYLAELTVEILGEEAQGFFASDDRGIAHREVAHGRSLLAPL